MLARARGVLHCEVWGIPIALSPGDLTRAGVFVPAIRAPEPASVLEVRLSLGQLSLLARALVVHVVAQGDGDGRTGYGVLFQDLEREDVNTLERILETATEAGAEAATDAATATTTTTATETETETETEAATATATDAEAGPDPVVRRGLRVLRETLEMWRSADPRQLLGLRRSAAQRNQYDALDGRIRGRRGSLRRPLGAAPDGRERGRHGVGRQAPLRPQARGRGAGRVGRAATLAVFDLGGGTFDVTILEASKGLFRVLATNGDAFLGGDDFDRVVLDHLLAEFEAQHGVDVSGEVMAMQRLSEAARAVKVELSQSRSAPISLPFLASDPRGGPLHMETTLRREQPDALCAHLIADVAGPCQDALEDAGIERRDIDRVLLVGGMTRMPAIRRRVAEIFGQEPHANINPDEAVALGAALQTGIVGGELEDVVLLDVTPHSLGIRVAGGKMSVIVDRNTTIPVEALKLFSTTKDDQSFVDIQVYQGECDDADDNTSIGCFSLHGLPPRPAGRVRVSVRFSIDADGLLSVTAKDQETGREATIDARRPHPRASQGGLHGSGPGARLPAAGQRGIAPPPRTA